MSQIRFNPEGLSAASTNLKNYAGELEGLIGKMQNVVSGLPDCWEGAASTAYVQQFTDLKPGLDKTKELIETIAKQIDQTLRAAQERDTKIAGHFK